MNPPPGRRSGQPPGTGSGGGFVGAGPSGRRLQLLPQFVQFRVDPFEVILVYLDYPPEDAYLVRQGQFAQIVGQVGQGAFWLLLGRRLGPAVALLGGTVFGGHLKRVALHQRRQRPGDRVQSGGELIDAFGQEEGVRIQLREVSIIFCIGDLLLEVAVSAHRIFLGGKSGEPFSCSFYL